MSNYMVIYTLEMQVYKVNGLIPPKHGLLVDYKGGHVDEFVVQKI